MECEGDGNVHRSNPALLFIQTSSEHCQHKFYFGWGQFFLSKWRCWAALGSPLPWQLDKMSPGNNILAPQATVKVFPWELTWNCTTPSNPPAPVILSLLIAPDPRPLTVTLQVSYQRVDMDLRARSDEPNAPSLHHLWGHVGGGQFFPYQKPLTRGRMIGEITRDSSSHQGAHDHPFTCAPSRTAAAQVLLNCPLPAPLRILFKAPSLPPHRWLGRRPHVPWLPRRRPRGGSPLYLPHTSHGSDPGGYVDAPVHVAQFLADLPQFSDLPSLLIKLRLLSFLTVNTAVGPSSLPSLDVMSFPASGGQLPPPLLNNTPSYASPRVPATSKYGIISEYFSANDYYSIKNKTIRMKLIAF